MSLFSRVTVVAALAAVLAFVPACGKKADTGKIKIGIVTNCTADFWSICEAGAKKAAEKHNVELQFRQPEKGFDTSVQTPIVEAWVKQGLDGIAVSVIDPNGQKEDLTRFAKKVPLIAVDNDAPGTGCKCYIGIDNYEAGKAVGRIVKSKGVLPNGGTVAIFIGSTKSANGKARTQGVLDELAGEKDAQGVVSKHPTRGDLSGRTFGKYFVVDASDKVGGAEGAAREDGEPSKAQATASAVLGRVKGVPDLCMVGLYAYNPPAILAEAKARAMAKDIKIVGFDEDFATLAAIAADEITATVVQDPFQYGYKSVEALATKNYEVPIIPYRVVTKTGDKIDGITAEVVPVKPFEDKLRADIASAKGK